MAVLQPALLGGPARCGTQEGRKAGKIVLAGQFQRERALVGEQVLAELGAELGEPRCDGRHALLGFGVELGPGAAEAQAVALAHPLLLVGQAVLGDPRDSRPQVRIEVDRAAVAGEPRRHRPLDRLKLGIGVAAGEVEEGRGDPAQGLARALHRLDRVGEGRGLRIAGDRLDLGDVLGQRPLEGRLVMRGHDALERRQPVRGGPGRLGEGVGLVLRRDAAHADPLARRAGDDRPWGAGRKRGRAREQHESGERPRLPIR